MAARKITLTLKAGISMSENSKASEDKRPAIQGLRTRAFTFIEVIAALAIVSISMLALLRLHLISIRMTDTAEITSQAVFLANQKIEELLALGYPKEGTNSGVVEKNGLMLNWQTEVADLHLAQLDEADVTGLRKILVDVRWGQGLGHKHMQMSTYFADRKINEQ